MKDIIDFKLLYFLNWFLADVMEDDDDDSIDDEDDDEFGMSKVGQRIIWRVKIKSFCF